ncbi:hypothetical protein, unlikely [Trypanosoma brucei gambiense DAL972]|uniref:Uncharacterized protein n=1 Tax=Trypanosoma brucei gambiense (strain MHOM/CI/86/DAL972) TaxID=679716 RepID=D0A260_TRYB9|nr:hypothetical protein, unlikely [Trypanosoma brucei gambiense DAL972]CBH15354.1 hypothetical protein, unlikely [Trypanosoma brucei gambiense DAL972]|eukprot:XP_011777618.1 hypothetical protein, unlikely [Trypanosoma brucei gambiense DAL972]
MTRLIIMGCSLQSLHKGGERERDEKKTRKRGTFHFLFPPHAFQNGNYMRWRGPARNTAADEKKGKKNISQCASIPSMPRTFLLIIKPRRYFAFHNSFIT